MSITKSTTFDKLVELPQVKAFLSLVAGVVGEPLHETIYWLKKQLDERNAPYTVQSIIQEYDAFWHEQTLKHIGKGNEVTAYSSVVFFTTSNYIYFVLKGCGSSSFDAHGLWCENFGCDSLFDRPINILAVGADKEWTAVELIKEFLAFSFCQADE